MADSKEAILEKWLPTPEGAYETNDIISAMDEYANEWKEKYNDANQFICELGKLLGQNGLGYDDMKWSIEDFRDAIDEKKKQFCLELLEYMAKNRVDCGVGANNNMFWYKGECLTRDQLFENFL